MASTPSTPKGGWEVKQIGDVCNLMTGGTPSRKKKEYFDDGTIKWLVSGDIHQKEIHDCEGRISALGLNNSNAKYLPLNSVMIALNGQGKTRGSVAMLRTKATCNQSLVSIFPKDASQLLPEYIYANLHGRYEEIRKITGDDGNDRRGLNMPLLRKIKIPVPPIAEQERIVGILDEAFEGIAAATAQAEKNLHNARELFQSVLQSTFSQKGDDWEETTLGDEVEFLAGFAFKSSEYTDSEDGIRLLRGDNIIQGEFRWEGVKRWPKVKAAEYAKFELAQNDVVLAMDRPWVTAGLKVASIEENDLPCLQVQRTARLRVGTELHWTYLFHLIRSSSFVQYILGGQTGLGVPHISGKQILAFQFPKPPLPTQQAIVEKLDALSEETKRLEAIYERKKAALAELKQALLQKAFAGEL